MGKPRLARSELPVSDTASLQSGPDELTLLTSRLVLEVNNALVRIPRLQGLTPARSARAEILAQLLKNVRVALLDS